ncbi:MAG: shikimate kinase [Candidatus Omnitrophica bacterium]|nr:shikimate kinase [Candidatus Omnitrophota bacterium]
MNIYLVGFMGTGKTSVGKELAKKTKRHFVDLDELIELKEKRSIADIFSNSGEPSFRKIESKVLKEVSREKNFVVGCGGGIVLDKDNMKVMKKTGLIVCLKASPQIILKRVCGYSHRPLLNVADQRKRITHLLKLRSPYYALAHKSIDTSKLTVKQVTAKIFKMIPMDK